MQELLLPKVEHERCFVVATGQLVQRIARLKRVIVREMRAEYIINPRFDEVCRVSWMIAIQAGSRTSSPFAKHSNLGRNLFANSVSKAFISQSIFSIRCPERDDHPQISDTLQVTPDNSAIGPVAVEEF